MRTAKIVLAGKEYEIRRLPAVRAIAWRKAAQELLDVFPALADAYQQETANVVAAGVDLFRQASGIVESLIEVVLSADVTLNADRERILETADDEEFLEAFQQALLLNTPLSSLAQA